VQASGSARFHSYRPAKDKKMTKIITRTIPENSHPATFQAALEESQL
jgi:hypothetical protein